MNKLSCPRLILQSNSLNTTSNDNPLGGSCICQVEDKYQFLETFNRSKLNIHIHPSSQQGQMSPTYLLAVRLQSHPGIHPLRLTSCVHLFMTLHCRWWQWWRRGLRFFCSASRSKKARKATTLQTQKPIYPGYARMKGCFLRRDEHIAACLVLHCADVKAPSKA